MRVLIANANRNPVGGVEKYLQILIPALRERNHEVALVYEKLFDPASERIDPPAGVPAWGGENNTAEVLAAVAEWKPSVVYSHGLEQPELEGGLLDAYPTVLYGHNYYGTCVSGRKCHMAPRPEPCAKRLGAACLLLYYPRRCGGLNPGTMWQLFRRQSELHSRLGRCQAVLVASEHMRREFQNNGVSQDKLHLIRLPVVEVGSDEVALSRKGHQGRILFSGRLTDLKGVGHLMRAIPQAARKLGCRLTLTIAGDGPDREKLHQLAGGLDLAAEFVGWVGSRQKFDLMRQADLLAMPSLWPEPFGLVGIEAGCFGLPAAGYAAGGIPEWLIPGKTGELAPANPPTVEGLADAIVRALADQAHYAELCRGAWTFSRQFSIQNHLERLEPILDAAAFHSSARETAALISQVQ